MNYTDIENAALNAWPALEEIHYPFGVMRFANGFTRRANSMTVNDSISIAPERLVAIAEAYYQSKSLPTAIRVNQVERPGLGDIRGLDQLLQKREYGREGESAVMIRPISKLDSAITVDGQLAQSEWLQIYQSLSILTDDEVRTLDAMLTKRRQNSCFFAVNDGAGRARCCGMGILYGSAMGLYGVITHPHYRGQGMAYTLLQRLFACGAQRRAEYFYLQVEISNHLAISLYEKLGFTRLYNYWYRVRPTSQHGTGKQYLVTS